ncbi:MAG TPA: tetratricopeptide repeat protein, partial [Opitutaceae bacterium]|nr:tetratricopeptide repeat protein [Opitutaceae bacterium]
MKPPAWICALLLLLAGGIAYHNSLSGGFVFDDLPATRDNPSLGTPWSLTAFSPPANSGVGGRPLANFSFALNRFMGGAEVRGYHAFNLLLHLGSALLLFGIVRRTSADAAPAFLIALAWTIHPSATAAVSYISQRTELLMAFFHLLTLYAFVREWRAVSVAACALGMLSKESMVAAPLVVLLYDRTFVSGTFRAAWRQRSRYYVGLGLTWLALGVSLLTRLDQRGVGFSLGVTPWQYALAECEAVVRYACLALWPAPLVFDYGRIYPGLTARIVVSGALLACALWQTFKALRRRSPAGFAAAVFFLVLAPTSTFVPVADQPIAENRMYLPLAAVVVLLAMAVRAVAGSRLRPVLLLGCVALTALTIARNDVYRTPVGLWQDTVRKRPQNPRAQFNAGVVLLDAGRVAEALPRFERALQLKPSYAEAHNSLGNALVQLGRTLEAFPHYAAAVRLKPDYARAWYNYGTARLQGGDAQASIPLFAEALRLEPGSAEAHNNLGNAYFQRDQPALAIPHYERALQLDPQLAEAHFNCGNACLELGRAD